MNFIKFKPFEYKGRTFEDGEEVGKYSNEIWRDKTEWKSFCNAITLYLFDYFKAYIEDKEGDITDDDNLTDMIDFFMKEVYEDFIDMEKCYSELSDYDLEDRWSEYIYVFKDPREEEVYYKLRIYESYYEGWELRGISKAEKKTKTITYFE